VTNQNSVSENIDCSEAYLKNNTTKSSALYNHTSFAARTSEKKGKTKNLAGISKSSKLSVPDTSPQKRAI